MTKLTTEILKEIIGSYPEGSEEMECLMAKKLLAYEQAARNPVASCWIKGGILQRDQFIRYDVSSFPDGEIKLFAAPILPKQSVGTLTDEGTIPAQPAIPEQALNTAKLINKFYERYPLKTFANDSERAEALGYFMAGAELQCFGDFIAYNDHVQESE